MIEGLVSIITPCYNGEKYISETIKSVLKQSYTNWEMLIIDDGSKDHSAEIVNSFAIKDQRIKLIQQENKGSAAARNNGIRCAEGQYIALLDADDLWLPEFLEKQISYMKKKNAICVSCAYGRINEKSEDILSPLHPKEIITTKDMMVMNRIGCLSGLYDTSKYGKIYLREELKSIRDDYAYWLDIVRLEGKAYGNQEVLAKYRVLENSTTGNKRKLIRKQYQFYREYLKLEKLASVANLVRWGIAGIIKFSR
ncbi:MAG: glycosyltransferase family 2 protein [Clostridium sp.]|nr:glycosyltransferase family 2 protein [Clostridium sp.]